METSETTALARVVPQTQQGLITKEALRIQKEQRELVKEFVRDMMVEGTDYGVIPGTPKPTLYKPGAEKLLDLFRCTPKFALVKSEEDFERGHGFFAYTFRVRLYQRDSEAVVAEGFGSANSREGRYRWRDAQRKCPKCAKATIFSSKEGGWFCWKKKGGCGAQFEQDAPAIVTQTAGKVENEDIATYANTILKMAKKRALVDGAIALARCSDLFTQDVEDLMDGAAAVEEPRQERHRQEAHRQEKPKQEAKPSGEKRAAPQASAKKAIVDVRAGETETDATARTVRASRIWTRAKALGMTEAQFPEWVGHVLGGKKRHADWTLADIEALEADLRDMDDGKKGSSSEPPPPSDADAPF